MEELATSGRRKRASGGMRRQHRGSWRAPLISGGRVWTGAGVRLVDALRSSHYPDKKVDERDAFHDFIRDDRPNLSVYFCGLFHHGDCNVLRTNERSPPEFREHVEARRLDADAERRRPVCPGDNSGELPIPVAILLSGERLQGSFGEPDRRPALRGE